MNIHHDVPIQAGPDVFGEFFFATVWIVALITLFKPRWLLIFVRNYDKELEISSIEYAMNFTRAMAAIMVIGIPILILSGQL